MAPSDAQKRARNNWDKGNMTVLACKIRKDKADKFKEVCKLENTTPNAVFTQAIDTMIERHEAQK